MAEEEEWAAESEHDCLQDRPSSAEEDVFAQDCPDSPICVPHLRLPPGHGGRRTPHGATSDLTSLMRAAMDVDGYYTQQQVESMLERLNAQQEGRLRAPDPFDDSQAATRREHLIDKLLGREDAAIKIQRAWRRFMKGKDKRKFMTGSLSIRRMDHYVPDRFYTPKKARAPTFLSYSIESASHIAPVVEEEPSVVEEPVTPAVKIPARWDPYPSKMSAHLECLQRGFGTAFMPAPKLYKSKTGGSAGSGGRSSQHLKPIRRDSSGTLLPTTDSSATICRDPSGSMLIPTTDSSAAAFSPSDALSSTACSDSFLAHPRAVSRSIDSVPRSSLPGLPLRPSILHTQSAHGHRSSSKARSVISSPARSQELGLMDTSSEMSCLTLPSLSALQIAWPEKSASGELSPVGSASGSTMLRSPSARARSLAGCEPLLRYPSPSKQPRSSDLKLGRRASHSEIRSLDTTSHEGPLVSPGSLHSHAPEVGDLGFCHSMPGFPGEGTHAPSAVPGGHALGMGILQGLGSSTSSLPRALQRPVPPPLVGHHSAAAVGSRSLGSHHSSAAVGSGSLAGQHSAVAVGSRSLGAVKNGSNGVLQPRPSHLAPLPGTSRQKSQSGKASNASKLFQEWKAQRKQDGAAVPEDGGEDHGESFLSYVQRRMGGKGTL